MATVQIKEPARADITRPFDSLTRIASDNGLQYDQVDDNNDHNNGFYASDDDELCVVDVRPVRITKSRGSLKGDADYQFTRIEINLSDVDSDDDDLCVLDVRPADNAKPGRLPETVVYTDGSLFYGRLAKDYRAGWGVFYGTGDSRNTSARVEGPQESNRAELSALVHVLETSLREAKLGKPSDLLIRTDSVYAKESLTVWAQKWEASGYVKANGQPLKNADLIRKGRAIIADLTGHCGVSITIEYVPSHSGDFGNDQADKLARAGALGR